MECCTILVLYVGKRFEPECDNNLMKCCVYIMYIYTIAICENNEGVTIIVFLRTMMIITEEQRVVIIKLRKYMVGLGDMGNSWGVVMVIFNSYLVCVNVI